MPVKQDLIQSRNLAFINSITRIRAKLAIFYAVFALLALGANGSDTDYVILGSYLIWNIFSLIFAPIRNLAVKFLRTPLIFGDVAFICYMIVRTGGITGESYLLLIIPVIMSAIRFGYRGIIVCCAGLSLFLLASQYLLYNILDWKHILPRICYLYIIGIAGGYLIRQTFKITEEVSNQLARKNDDLQRLNDHLQEISASSDLERIFTETLKIIKENNTTPMAAILVFDMQGELKIVDSFGWREEWLKNYDSYPLSKYSLTLAPILVFKKRLSCPDVRKHTELVQTFEGAAIRSLFAYPLIIQDEVIGALLITDVKEKPMPEEESRILERIAFQTSIALQNTISLKEEKKKAEIDGLTGAYNRRYFNETIEAVVAQTVLNPRNALSLIILDIDNFKRYNDTYGHPAGDTLLKRVSGLIMEAVREEDIVARYGGEEFAIILRDCDNRLALQIAERIRRSIEVGAELNSTVTVSLGVATLPEHAMDGKNLIEYADRSLYSAKNSGKNKVCCGF